MRVFRGEDVGTLIGAVADDRLSGRRRSQRKNWISYFHRAQGTVVVDDGARTAILESGRSLLPVGVKEVQGEFNAGAMVNVCDVNGAVIARGLVSYASSSLDLIKGHKTSEIGRLLGEKCFDEVIHRDNMIVLEGD